jgi:hypothetical protein
MPTPDTNPDRGRSWFSLLQSYVPDFESWSLFDNFMELHWFLRTALLIILLFAALGLMKKFMPKAATDLLMLLIIAFVIYQGAAWAKDAGSTRHVHRDDWGGPLGTYIDSDNMSYDKPWVRTSYVLTRGNDLTVDVQDFLIKNSDQEQCPSSGCKEEQLDGKPFRPDLRHMAVVARIGDHENAIYVGSGTTLTAEQYGEGVLQLSVNQVRRRSDGTPAHEEWDNMNGGFRAIIR